MAQTLPGTHLRHGGAHSVADRMQHGWHRFRAWWRRHPLVGGVLIVLAGIETFLSTQLDLGNIHVEMGVEGLQGVVIPIALVLLGILAICMPAHHVFYGVIALVIAVYSVIGVNLGGFFLGMLLGVVGGVLVVAWRAPASTPAPDQPRREELEP